MEGRDRAVELLNDLVGELLFLGEQVAHFGHLLPHERQELLFPRADLAAIDLVQGTAVARVDDQDLLGDRQRAVGFLLQNLDHAVAAVELLLRHLVEFRTELGERFEFAERGERELEAPGDSLVLHRADLCVTTDAGDGNPDVHGGHHACVLQVGLQVDLAIGDRNHVGRNVRGDFAVERFNDRQRSQRTTGGGDATEFAAREVALDIVLGGLFAGRPNVHSTGRTGLAVLVRVAGGVDAPVVGHARGWRVGLQNHVAFGELRGTLEQTAVAIEHVAGVGFAAGRATNQQRQLAVRRSLFRQVVVHAKCVFAFFVHEVFGHRGAGVRCDVLKRGGIGGRCDDDDGVFECAEFAELLDDTGDLRFHLAAGDVDADHAFAFLRQNGIDGDLRFAGLAVADDEFALAAADRRHGVDRLDAGLQRRLHRLAVDDAGGHRFDGPTLVGNDRAFAVDRVAKRVDDAADQGRADGHRKELPGRADLHPFANLEVVPEDDDRHGIFFEVEGETFHPGFREVDHLAGHNAGETVATGDAVADLENLADFARLDLAVVASDLVGQNADDFVGFNF